ncbi:MAG: twin-arginine translocase subunit TatC [Planctomycetaceae bacterium]|nr:twin-arginine translocase subunit TatC [Planctomycetales bacterium]MCB9874736.1 twin-arginine translocase subunit TatC [Planctomycetaceae bacterium]
MAKHSNEDLFEGTKMTFGEHLEELRVVLVRGLLGLTIGVLLGMLAANSVVKFVEGPLIVALEKHFGEVAKEELHRVYPDKVPPELDTMATEHGFIFEEIFIERSELARLGTAAAEPPADSDSVDLETLLKKELPAPTIDLVKTRIWRPSRARLTTLSPHEAFMIWLKAGFVTGFILASPYIFFQIWMFVAAGLYPHEQRYVYVFLPFSLVLFLAGAALAFFFVFGPVLDFLFSFSRSMGIDPDLRISEVISFVLFMPLGFGVAFQLPLVMLLLNRIGIFSIEAYLEKWRIAILGIFVISMFLTPADPVSMLLMAVPLTALYFLGVGLCQWMPRGRNPFDEAYEP